MNPRKLYTRRCESCGEMFTFHRTGRGDPWTCTECRKPKPVEAKTPVEARGCLRARGAARPIVEELDERVTGTHGY